MISLAIGVWGQCFWLLLFWLLLLFLPFGGFWFFFLLKALIIQRGGDYDSVTSCWPYSKALL